MTSGWTMLVFPALAFDDGAVHLWTVVSLVLGIWFVWVILGKKIRRYTILEDSLTLPEFFEKRFDDSTGVLRGLSAILTIFFIMIYVDSGLIAGSKLLETVFELDSTTGVLVTLVAVASYTFIGGFLAVSRTDVFQAMLMLGCFLALPLILIGMTDEPFQGLGQDSDFLNPLTGGGGQAITVVFLLSTSGWGLGAFGSQRVLQRLMAVESEKKMGVSRNIGTAWVTLIFGFGFLLGLVARPALAEAGILGLVDTESVYIVVAQEFFVPVMTGLLLTGVIAAIMSTADSQLLLGSAIATDDMPIMKRFAYRIRYEYAAVGMLFYRTGVADLPPREQDLGHRGANRRLARSDPGRVRQGMAGTAHAVDDRRGRSRPRAPVPQLHIQPCRLRLGRNGGGLRPGHDPGPVLAQVQRLGSGGLDSCGRRRRYLLAVHVGRPVGDVRHGHSGGPRLHSRDGGRRSGHAAHVRALGEGGRAVREGEPRPARRPGRPFGDRGHRAGRAARLPGGGRVPKPRQGHEWVTATLRLRNVGGRPDESDHYHDVEFPLIGEHGVTYDDIFAPPATENRLGSGEISGGEEVTGDVVREGPQAGRQPGVHLLAHVRAGPLPFIGEVRVRPRAECAWVDDAAARRLQLRS